MGHRTSSRASIDRKIAFSNPARNGNFGVYYSCIVWICRFLTEFLVYAAPMRNMVFIGMVFCEFVESEK